MEDSGDRRWDLRIIGAIGAGLLVAGLATLLWLDPRRAGEVVVEDGLVEWAQAGFLLAGWVVIVARAMRKLARGESAIPELLLGALLTVGISVELSLHSWVGFRIRHGRFSLRHSAGPVFPWVVLSVSLIVGLTAVRHLVRHRRSLLSLARDLSRSRWGKLTIAGITGYAGAHLFETPVKRFMPGPSYFLEESIELVAAVYLCLAAWQLAGTRSARTTSWDDVEAHSAGTALCGSALPSYDRSTAPTKEEARR